MDKNDKKPTIRNSMEIEDPEENASNSDSLKISRYSRTKIIKLIGSRKVTLEPEYIPRLMQEASVPEYQKDKFIEFMNAECLKGQENSELDMADLEPFNSLNQWTGLVRDGAPNEHGGQELATMMKLIATTEDHPDIKSCGIDFEYVIEACIHHNN